jgi:hypothetical protein
MARTLNETRIVRQVGLRCEQKGHSCSHRGSCHCRPPRWGHVDGSTVELSRLAINPYRRRRVLPRVHLVRAAAREFLDDYRRRWPAVLPSSVAHTYPGYTAMSASIREGGALLHVCSCRGTVALHAAARRRRGILRRRAPPRRGRLLYSTYTAYSGWVPCVPCNSRV